MVYDPTTGQVRPGSTDDIACWFIDANYNRESFRFGHKRESSAQTGPNLLETQPIPREPGTPLQTSFRRNDAH
jgi:hypothetical protein